ncbi:MAG: archease [Deltaproteobacteria bacterium]|nr:archease [Deltaproteobacteria bacterium]MBI2540121.1 archease [Deltaproteobacteria bacterium]MBI2992237.1 archease [Deltaproteobacteria bacterium]
MTERPGGYRQIEHTADLGMEIEAADLPGLFASGAEALYSLIADRSGIEEREEISVVATGDDWEELFHAWLRELLAQFNLKGFVGGRCEITSVAPGRAEGRINGESLDLKRHRFYTEIKGVTYHGFRVWQENGRWKARVIFDV